MRVPPGNPANPLYRVEQLAAQVVELRAMLVSLMQAGGVGLQRAQITAYVGGATTCTVTFLANGLSGSCRFPVGFTPTVSHVVFVVTGPEGRMIIGRDSVP